MTKILSKEIKMADYTVDARGLSCPEPVVRTKKAFDAHQNFTVLVDNETSKENVIRFCDKMKAKTSVSADGSDWKISVSK